MSRLELFKSGTIITSLYPRDNPLMLFENEDLTGFRDQLKRNEAVLVVKSKVLCFSNDGKNYDTVCVLRQNRLFWANCDFAKVAE